MSAQELALVAGAVLSLAFTYIPGLNTKYAGLSSQAKQLIMAGLLLLVAGGSLAISCGGLGAGWGIDIECSVAGFQGLVTQFILALVANQGAYGLSPEPRTVTVEKAARPE